MNEIIVGRPINGITLNDLEYLLNENGNIMKFKSKEHAIGYLKKQGVSDVRKARRLLHTGQVPAPSP